MNKVHARSALVCLFLASVWLGACAGSKTPAKPKDGGGGTGGGNTDGQSVDMALPKLCSDLMDNDGDGKTDYPVDPGCDSRDDDTEDDPSVKPECSDGMDNDMDGATDYPADLGCAAASGTDESFNPFISACGMGIDIRDITKAGFGTGDFLSGEMPGPNKGSCGGMEGKEDAFLYRLTTSGKRDLVITTVDASTTADTVLYVRTACADEMTEIAMACNDDVSATVKHSEVILRGAVAGKYYIIVDGKGAGFGGYKVKVTSYISEGEACGATADGGVMEMCRPGLMCQPTMAGGPAICTPAHCMDGLDNDADGKTDYPNDPGCDTAADNDEADPAVLPECGDGIDNDMDGKTDYPNDPGCMAASGIDESSDPIADGCGTGVDVRDITKAAMATGTVAGTDTPGPHQGSCGGMEGKEQVFLYRLGTTGKRDITITTVDPATTTDTVLYARSPSCEMTTDEKGCNDDTSGTVKASEIVIKDAAPGKYYIFVDGKPTVPGMFTLKITPAISLGEPCGPPLAEMCSAGLLCKAPMSGMPTVCAVPACKDGVDNDTPADGKTDFPNDPGCATDSDDDESDTCPGAGCPRCGDGMDNDGDGQTDYPNDPHCVAASDDDEREECVAGLPIDTLTVAGVTDMTAGSSLAAGTCGLPGPERVYRFTVAGTYASIVFSTNHPETMTTDTAVYVREPMCSSTAPADEKVCDNDINATNKKSRAVLTSPTDGTTYYVFVDSAAAGPFKLTVLRRLAEGATCVPAATDIVCGPGLLCKGASGSETCQKPACDDTLDNESVADGKIDFPNDPGCKDALDDDESDDCPSGPLCPQCGNGMDDDTDSKTDFSGMDTGCTAASDPLEVKVCKAASGTSPPVTLLTDDGATGNVPTSGGKFQGTCSPDPFPFSVGSYGEVVFAYPVTRSFKSLTFSTMDPATTADTVLYVRTGACNTGMELACSDNFMGTPRSQVAILNPALTVHYVFVDRGAYAGAPQPFRLKVSGILNAGAECDPAGTSVVCDTGLTCKAVGSGLDNQCQP